MNIEILAVTPTTKPTAKGSYTQLDIAYKRDGKTEGKKIMSFGPSKPAYDVLKDAKLGQVYTITAVKNETSGYWDWTAASSGAATPTETKGNSSPKSTYETPEERAKKQVYIIRQSSIANAISLLHNDKKAPDVKEVLSVAQQFVDFVFDIEPAIPELPDDDIPL